MRLLFITYPICQTLSGKLSWSHYTELLSVSCELARSFYEKQCVHENWSVRELKRQRSTSLFERIALSKDRHQVLDLAKKGHVISSAQDLIKDPYVFEFLNISENNPKESDIEDALDIKL